MTRQDPKRRAGTAAAALVACALAAPNACAALLVGTAGNATGVNGLVVGSEVYNVSFLAQSYNTVYPADDAPFLGNAAGGAQAAALSGFLTSEAVSGVLGFDCVGNSHQCNLVIPTVSNPGLNLAIGPDVFVAPFVVGNANWLVGTAGYPTDCVGVVTGIPCYNPGLTGLFALADFERVPTTTVPEPGVLAMVGVAMSGLAAARRRRRTR